MLLSLDFQCGEYKQFEMEVEWVMKVILKEVVFVVSVVDVVVTEFQKL